MKIVAFLPAKGTSERIENKNMKLLNGKPLFLYTLEKLTECAFIDEVYLDSESNEILEYAPYLNYIPLKRSPDLANNQTDGNMMFFNEVEQVQADMYIQILGTSPFIMKETIQRGINVLLTQPEYDSVVLVRREKHYLWTTCGPAYPIEHIPNSRDLEDTIIETMGLYIVRSEAAHRIRRRIGDHPFLLDAEAMESLDINYPDDFALAETVMRGLTQAECIHFNLLSRHLSTALLSDLLWDSGYRAQVVTGLIPNQKNVRVMGRASTLKIRRLKEGEDFRGIYDALDTYREIRPGEIILVENECSDRAYFGELNANLALRSGAVAAVVDRVSRDVRAVTHLGFPVFARNWCCCDVRGLAVVESFRQTIHMAGVLINPGDLIFCDEEGMVVIPRKAESKIIQQAETRIRTERSVLNRILNNEDAHKIYEQEGAF